MSQQGKENKKRSIGKLLSFGGLFIGVGALALIVPTELEKNKVITLNYDHSTETYEGNKNRINNFIDVYLSENYYNLSGSLNVFGNPELIGEEGQKLTSSQRSLITVEEAFKHNMFKLDLSSNFLYSMNKNKINYELAYIKPYYSDSTYPLVGLKLFYGEGASFYQTYFEFRDTSLYGFKKNFAQTTIDTYIEEINKNPSEYFKLKKEVGVPGQPGLYAKNIKVDDIDLNSPKLVELRASKYWVSVTSLKADETNPSLLKITYTISYDDGVTTNFTSGREVKLGTFDIHTGVDDPESKVKKFIKDNKDWINALNQYFSFDKPKVNEGEKEQEFTILDAYKQNLISFNPSYAVRSKLKDNGIKFEFKKYSPTTDLYVSCSEFDSTSPMYRLDVTSYANTPLEYTESVYIEGVLQQGDFKISVEQEKMTAFWDYITYDGIGIEEIFDFDWQSNNPLSLSKFFTDNQVAYTNGKYNISFDILNQLYKLYKENKDNTDNPYFGKNPFDAFRFVKKRNDLKVDYEYNGQIYNMNEIANEILAFLNGGHDFTEVLESITDNDTNPTMNINISLGDKNQGTMFTALQTLEISLAEHFTSRQEYNGKVLSNVKNWINANQNEVIFELVDKNGVLSSATIENLLRERKYKEIFSTVTVYNIPNNIFPFSEFQSPLEILINFDYLEALDFNQIENIIKTKRIMIEIKILLGNDSEIVRVEKTFDQLLNGI